MVEKGEEVRPPASLGCYTETLLRDVCCENTCLPPWTWRNTRRTRGSSLEEYYTPSMPRYIASQSAFYARRTTKLFYPGKSWQTSRLTSRERVRDSSSIVPLPSSSTSLSLSLCRRIKRRADQIVGPILVSPHLFSASIEFVCPFCRDGRWYYGSRVEDDPRGVSRRG